MNTLSARKKKSATPLPTDWKQMKWKKAEKYVDKLQKRIFHAEKEGNKRRVRNLQRMLMKSKSALVMSIRRVTQINKGKRTAGVDGFKVLAPEGRLALYYQMVKMDISLHKPKPAYRTYIQKKNGKLRPLGIPTIKDRVYQNIAKMALEPQWEARFEPTSYGFRPKRSCHDAIERIFCTTNGNGKISTKNWIFEGDFKACFDTLDHGYIMKQLGSFPERDIISKWLKAGFMDKNVFNKTEEGTPQGGIISPLLANIALHGMEEVLGIKYIKNGSQDCNRTKYSMCRYADDFIIMCSTLGDANNIKEILADYLSDRGLTLAEDKTKISHIEKGFNFLGFNIRRYTVTKFKKGKQAEKGKKLLIKPSKESVQKLKDKIKDEFAKARGNNAQALIGRINPIIIGTANYWSSSVAKEIFNNIDKYMWTKVKRWLNRSHRRKNWKWKKKKYFKPDKTGQSKNKWIFTDPVTNNQVKKMAWTKIRRYVLIKHNSSPYDKNLEGYYKQRDIKEFDRNNVSHKQKLAKKQNYVCPICKRSITDFKEGLEIHHIIPKHYGGCDEYKNLQLVHISCHVEYHKAFLAEATIPPKSKVNAWLKWYRRSIG